MPVFAVVGDIHGNLPALESVMLSAGEVAGWWCIGDTVGYGPYPEECIARLRGLDAAAVVGNHDLGAVGGIGLDNFNSAARDACEWTASVIGEDEAEYLRGLPMKRAAGGTLLVHGSPRDPVWEYVTNGLAAVRNMRAFSEPLCFNGHSHCPAVYSWPGGAGDTEAMQGLELLEPDDGDTLELEHDRQYLVNVGSVGQPRDGDPRACYVRYDPEERTVAYSRVEYPIAPVQERIRELGLPEWLAARLGKGA